LINGRQMAVPGAFPPSRERPAMECGGAQLRVYSRKVATVVAISGDVDGTNIDRVQAHIRGLICEAQALVLDLSAVECLGVAGLRALSALGDQCEKAGVKLAVVADRFASLTLRADDRANMLPVCGSLAEALELVANRGKVGEVSAFSVFTGYKAVKRVSTIATRGTSATR
jgi:anti-anti-sigma factor